MMFGSSFFNCFVQTVQVDHATLAYLAEHLHVGTARSRPGIAAPPAFSLFTLRYTMHEQDSSPDLSRTTIVLCSLALVALVSKHAP